MMRRGIAREWFLGLGLSLMLGLTAAFAQSQPRITADVKDTPARKLTAKEQQALSLAAGRILIHVNYARNHLRHNRPKEAQNHVDKAVTLARIIEAAVPEQRIESTIRAGNVVYRDNETVKPLIVPVYPELDDAGSVVIPLRRVKREAAAASDTTTGQTEGQIQFTTVLLDTGETKYYLDEAAAALKNNELTTADKALLSIQEEVEFDYDETNVPLVKTRWYLVDASRKMSRKDFPAAKEALHKAAGSVETYMGQASENLADTARVLADDINHLAIKLDEKKDRATDLIYGLWSRVLDLM